MMKKFVFGSCFIFSLFNGDCWGMNRAMSDPVLSVTDSMVDGSRADRPSSAPVTRNEIENAIDRWSHLVPSGETKSEIDELLPSVMDSEHNMQDLIQLLCSSDSKYANYAFVLFSDIFAKVESNICFGYGSLLSYMGVTKASDTPEAYWSAYKNGDFD